jgi:hypothetical protein
MDDWQIQFQRCCDEMKKNGENNRTVPERGEIHWCPDLECPKCHNKGTFYGDDLDYGAFYECAFARYCPSCQRVYDAIKGRNFAPYDSPRFLPIMKRKLMVNPPHIIPNLEQIREAWGFASITRNEKSCPICSGDTYTFHKDLGSIDYYDNYWTVCVSPNCKWPGEHRETYESGPY